MKVSSPTDILTRTEWRKRFGLSNPSYYRWIHEAGIPHFRIGRAIFVLRADFEAWLKKQTAKGSADREKGDEKG